jgi:hypothetical protein
MARQIAKGSTIAMVSNLPGCVRNADDRMGETFDYAWRSTALSLGMRLKTDPDVATSTRNDQPCKRFSEWTCPWASCHFDFVAFLQGIGRQFKELKPPPSHLELDFQSLDARQTLAACYLKSLTTRGCIRRWTSVLETMLAYADQTVDCPCIP